MGTEREKIIRKWFSMWLSKEDRGILELFSPNIVYIESWGPEYHGSEKIRYWFWEWNEHGDVLKWEIQWLSSTAAIKRRYAGSFHAG